MQDDDQISQRARQNREADDRPGGDGTRHRAQAGNQPDGDGLADGQDDPGLTELPAGMVPEDSGRADGRIIEAGEGGTAGGLDEAEEALASGVPDAREGR